MIATAMLPAEDLLVVRELRAMMPSLARVGRNAQKIVTLVAQLEGESHNGFATRVIDRTRREAKRGRPPKTVVVSVDAAATKEMLDSRVRLVKSLAGLLDPGPDSVILIQAPASCGSAAQCSLFELVEAVTRAVPSLRVRLTFEKTTERNLFQLDGRTRESHPAETSHAAIWS